MGSVTILWRPRVGNSELDGREASSPGHPSGLGERTAVFASGCERGGGATGRGRPPVPLHWRTTHAPRGWKGSWARSEVRVCGRRWGSARQGARGGGREFFFACELANTRQNPTTDPSLPNCFFSFLPLLPPSPDRVRHTPPSKTTGRTHIYTPETAGAHRGSSTRPFPPPLFSLFQPPYGPISHPARGPYPAPRPYVIQGPRV